MLGIPYGLRRLAAPATEPVSLAEAKDILKFDATLTSEDSLINTMRLAAINIAEQFTNRRLITQSWRLTLDRFPAMAIEIPFGGLQSVDAITYMDTTGNQQTWPVDLYRVDSSGLLGRVTPTYGQCFPQTQCVTGAVSIDFTCGYGDQATDVPEEIRTAILFMTRLWYDNRASGTIPPAAETLLWPHRLVTF